MTQQFIQWLTPAVQHFHVAGYWIAFLAAILETILGIGLLLPGSTIILLLGALSAQGYLDIGDLIWFAVAGAILGDNVNYHLGKRFGARWTDEGIWFLKKEHFEKATIFFRKHGAKSVFWGRFIPSVKEMVPFIAGLAGMRPWSFMIWNILGGIGWGLQWVFTGYIFAQSLYLAKMWMSRMGFLAVIILIIFLAFYFVRLAILKYGRSIIQVASSLISSIKLAVVNNQEVKNLIQRHPRFFEFMFRRFARKAFSGLPLTLLLLSFFYILILFTGIVEDFLTGDPIVSADIHISNLIFTFRSPSVVKFFYFITLLGKWQVVLVISFIFSLTLYIWERRYELQAFWIILLGSQLFTQLSKLAFHRSRPLHLVFVEHSYSFPSGHATVAVALYGFIAYVLIHKTSNWKARVNYLFASLLVILLIGASRLYLGVHYLSDVWSGYLVGSLWLVIGIAFFRYSEQKQVKINKHNLVTKKKIALTASMILISIVFYAGFAFYYSPEISIPETPRTVVIHSPDQIFSNDRIKYTESITGERETPINMIIISKNVRQLSLAFEKSGWSEADRIGLRSITKLFYSYFSHKNYNSAPIRPLFWNNQINDLCFEIPMGNLKNHNRRAIRIWKTSFSMGGTDLVFIGQASISDDLISEINHRISLDVDAQREWICQSFTQHGITDGCQIINLADPTSGQNLLGNPFVTDGNASILKIIQVPGN